LPNIRKGIVRNYSADGFFPIMDDASELEGASEPSIIYILYFTRCHSSKPVSYGEWRVTTHSWTYFQFHALRMVKCTDRLS